MLGATTGPTFMTQCALAWSWMGLPFPGLQTRMSYRVLAIYGHISVEPE